MLSIENEIFYQKFKNGDPKTISRIFDHYYAICLYTSFNLLGSKEDAEDAVSAAFTALWEKRDKFDEQKCRLKTWLLMIVRRRSIDLMRKRHDHISIDDEHIILIPAKEHSDLEYREMMLEILGSLSPTEKELFYRKFFYFQSYAEIASQTGKTINSVKSALYRIRISIKSKFDREDTLYG